MNVGRHQLGIEIALLALLSVLWGSSYFFIKIALNTIPPATLIAARVSGAAAFLLIVVVLKGRRMPMDGRSWRFLFIQAICNSIGAWTLLAWGQQYVDSSVAGVLNSTSPIFVFFITHFFTRHETTSALKLVGACLGVVGVVLLVGVDTLSGLGRQVMAQLAILMGAMFYAGAAIHGKRLSHMPPVISAAGTMIMATIFLVPISIAVDQPWTLRPSVQSIFAAITLSTCCTGAALLIYFRLVKTLGSMGVASQSYLRSGVSVLLGAVFLGEQITFLIGLGLTAVILGVVVINAPWKTG